MLGFFFWARKYFLSINRYTRYIFQGKPDLEYCSHNGGSTSLNTKLLSKIDFCLFNVPHEPLMILNFMIQKIINNLFSLNGI